MTSPGTPPIQRRQTSKENAPDGNLILKTYNRDTMLVVRTITQLTAMRPAAQVILEK